MINSPYTARGYKEKCQGKQMQQVLYYHDCNKLIQWCQLWLQDSDYEIWCVLNLMAFSALLVSSLLSNVILCSHLSDNKRNIIDCANSVTTVCFTINCVSGPFYPGECAGPGVIFPSSPIWRVSLREQEIMQDCLSLEAFPMWPGHLFFKWLCSKKSFWIANNIPNKK